MSEWSFAAPRPLVVFLDEIDALENNVLISVLRHLLSEWTGCELSLVMDRTDIVDRRSILTIGVAYPKRLLPLAWDVLPFGGTSAARQIALIERIRPYLPLSMLLLTVSGPSWTWKTNIRY